MPKDNRRGRKAKKDLNDDSDGEEHPHGTGFYCNICDKYLDGFARRGGLTRHMETHADVRKLYYCTYTDESGNVCTNTPFLSETNLREHVGAVQ